MRIATFLARSRASFLIAFSSLRTRSFWRTFSSSFSASSLCSCSQRTTRSFTAGTIQPRTSEPSLVLVWESKTGSWILIATAPTMPSRTSSPAKDLPENSFTAFSTPSRKALWWVPPSLVYWPLTKRVVGLAVGVGVGEGELEALDAFVHERVERLLAAHLVREQIGEAALRDEALALVLERQAGVQEGVVAQPVGDELFVPGEAAEDLGVGFEGDFGAVARLVVLAVLVALRVCRARRWRGGICLRASS